MGTPVCGLLNGTYFDRKSRWEFQFDEVSQSGKMSASSGHQVNDGDDLLHERERKLLTHPQHCFKPAGLDEKRLRPSPSDRETALLLRSRLDNASFLTPHAPAFPVILPPLSLSWERIRATKSSHHLEIGQAGEMICATSLYR